MKIKGFLLVAAVLFPLNIYAEDKPTTQEMFNKLDTNKDGYISQKEAKADKNLSKDWSKVDSDKKGKIDESQFSAFEESREPSDMPSESPAQPSEESAPMK